MSIWAIADLHLSFGVPNKSMALFGSMWEQHHEKIQVSWNERVKPDDLVLIPGDISWALRINEVLPDLEWIHQRPGTKVMIKGNHDHWWGSLNKVQQALPPSIHVIQNNAYQWNDVAIGGARLWDTIEYSFDDLIEFRENPKQKSPKILSLEEKAFQEQEKEKIFTRELQRLEASLKEISPNARLKIVMTHYPPIGQNLQDSRVSKLLEKAGIHHCVFGHLHSFKKGLPSLFGKKNGVHYHLTSSDWLHFQPLKIA